MYEVLTTSLCDNEDLERITSKYTHRLPRSALPKIRLANSNYVEDPLKIYQWPVGRIVGKV